MTEYLHAAIYKTADGFVGYVQELGQAKELPTREEAEQEVYRYAEEAYGLKDFEILWL